MKVKASSISKALVKLIEDLQHEQVLYDLKIMFKQIKTKTGATFKAPDKQWFCSDITRFNKLGEYLQEVLDAELKEKEELSKEYKS